MERKIPSVLWIALLSGGLMVIDKLIAAIAMGKPVILIDASLTALFLAGLYWGHKWAYVLVILFTILGIGAATLRNGPAMGMFTLLFDCLVLVPVVMSTYFFFPKKEPLGDG